MNDWLILAALMSVFYAAIAIARKTSGRKRIRYLFGMASLTAFLLLMWPVLTVGGKGFATQFTLWLGMTVLAGGYILFLERQADAE
ncbi:hypothetical protein [Paraurantiacibacter namhicola]|uniref:Uncharacterized protein n=1 Tax=Paraurantiacibacter namhicola TaxID=645517 RepID=A0A1C7D8T6_9SPHN|nr:hypothetical protein [Paraurantiacibacter namhicola]ANU07906.1 hypothetical protein A6F65_01607 [Paraurantiacibacter namhicola]